MKCVWLIASHQAPLWLQVNLQGLDLSMQVIHLCLCTLQCLCVLCNLWAHLYDLRKRENCCEDDRIFSDFLLYPGKQYESLRIRVRSYLGLMPSFEFFLVLLCHVLILGPYFCHKLSKVLSLSSINIYMDSWFGNLVVELHDILQRKMEDCKICYMLYMFFCFPPFCIHL